LGCGPARLGSGGHDTYGRLGIIQNLESGAVRFGASGVFEHVVMATGQFLRFDRARRHFTSLRCFDGGCFFGELVVLEPVSHDRGSGIHRLFSLAGGCSIASALSDERNPGLTQAQKPPATAF